jgi:hypothetical protein
MIGGGGVSILLLASQFMLCNCEFISSELIGFLISISYSIAVSSHWDALKRLGFQEF